MSYDFSADEIFAMAEQLERNGAQFYRHAAQQVAEPERKAFLEQLALMEDDHEKTFAAMRADLGDSEKGVTTFDPQGEAVLYLKALADTRVFLEKEIDLSSMELILKAAIEAEKESIVFYLGMKSAVPGAQGKRRMEAIIKEEMGHIRLLSQKLARLKS
ncbi:MAG: ferritin family protein [Desulfobacterales bacterium]